MTIDPSAIRVLLLEDEVFIRDTIRLMMRVFRNVELRECADGSEGLKLMDDGFSPDVALCDVQMTPTDGLAFLRQIRESRDPGRSALPVIMLTGTSQPEIVRAAAALGICGYLIKPVSVTKLAERLTAALDGSSAGHRAVSQVSGKTLTRR